MKRDPTIGDVIERVRSAPKRLLEVRVSAIGCGIALGTRMLLLTTAYVAIVLLLGTWWHAPSYVYVIAFVIAPLYWIREWWRERKRFDDALTKS